jgi:DNA replicative helicase MCM subunit Mcm2 (Cdc46/Mcm family)
LPNNRLAQKETGLIPQEMLKKYLIYSKKFMKPKLNEIDQDKIT